MEIIHESDVESVVYATWFPSRRTFKPLMSFNSDFGMVTLTWPVVPEAPVTVKLSSLLVELKANADTVEFEFNENTVWSEAGVNAKLVVVLAAFMNEVA